MHAVVPELDAVCIPLLLNGRLFSDRPVSLMAVNYRFGMRIMTTILLSRISRHLQDGRVHTPSNMPEMSLNAGKSNIVMTSIC